MATHRVEPDARTLHGHFSRDLEPVVTIDSGDRVRFATLDAAWGDLVQLDPFAPARKFAPRDKARDPGHALCGPVAVRGAEPGMTLEVRLHGIRPGAWGWTSAGGFASPLNVRLGLAEAPEHVLRWSIDAERRRATNQNGLTVRLRPFMGMLGNAPAEPGSHSTIPPRATGGNIDCRELVEGSVLYLPIAVPGALFSTGDGHGRQGDGEVAGPALECPMEDVDIELIVRDDLRLAMPRAETPVGWITFGFDTDLDEAAHRALDGMLDLIAEQRGVDRKGALALASLLVDLHVTQLVNGVRGVHAILPRDAFEA